MEREDQIFSTVSSEDEGETAIRTEETLTILYLTIGSLGLAGNALVLVVIAYHRPMRKRLSNVYICSQSVLDLLVSFFLILTTVYQDEKGSNLSGKSGQAYCRLWLTKMPLWGLLVSSSYNLVALTIERYLTVVHAVWHKIHFNSTKVWISIVFAVVVGLGYNMAYMIPTAGLIEGGGCTVYSVYPSVTVQRFNGILTIMLQFMVPLIILVFCYTRMAMVLRMRVQPSSDAPATVNAPMRNTSRARKNIIKTLAMVSACFVLCWIWNQVYFLMYNTGYEIDFTGTFYHFTVVAVFCNCCVNPFIYMAKYEQFQEGLKRLFCKMAGGNAQSSTDGASVTAVNVAL